MLTVLWMLLLWLLCASVTAVVVGAYLRALDGSPPSKPPAPKP